LALPAINQWFSTCFTHTH